MVQGDDPMLTPQMIETVVKSNNNHNQVTNICNNIKLIDAKNPTE